MINHARLAIIRAVLYPFVHPEGLCQKTGLFQFPRKAEKALKSYEEKLGLVNSYKENRERAQKAYRIIESAGISEPYADKLKRLIDQITE